MLSVHEFPVHSVIHFTDGSSPTWHTDNEIANRGEADGAAKPESNSGSPRVQSSEPDNLI
jgi:hypothetical protein